MLSKDVTYFNRPNWTSRKTMSEMKNLPGRLNGRLDMAEED